MEYTTCVGVNNSRDIVYHRQAAMDLLFDSIDTSSTGVIESPSIELDSKLSLG